MHCSRRAAIIGVGNVGSTTAFSLASQGLVNELVLIDIKAKKSEGDAFDLEDAAARLPVQIKVWANDWEKAAESDIMILSAGPLPRPDQTRLDTLEDAKKIVNEVVPRLLALNFQGLIVNITNPCDVVSHHLWKKSGFPAARVFGTGTLLDTFRLKKILGKITGTAPSNIEGFSLGEHGDSQVVPWSHVSIGGMPLLDLMAEDKTPEGRYRNLDLKELNRQVAYAGWEVLLRKGATYYGIATAAADLVRAILNDERRVLPVSAGLSGQYGLEGLHIGVPALIGAGGVEEIIELKLTDGERAALRESAKIIQSYIAKLDERSFHAANQ
ncbi:MAG: L-lactate dehydrogenase [Treponema sp.]|jgi:L-lactate dehydrogenase|nr:L-lactate dehydrogenase [Treponema sp.]